MARLIVVTTPTLAVGYRLAGAATVSARSSADARSAIERLVEEPDVALVAIHGPFWHDLDPAFIDRLHQRVLPVVIDIPTGSASELHGRRARLAEMLRHAIGHRITFRREEKGS